MSFEVAMKALVADADRWEAMSTALTGISGDCAHLQLDASAFSFLGGDVHSAYQQVLTFVVQFIKDGSTEVHGASGALDYVHSVYAGTDDAAKQAIESQWKWE